MRSTTPSLNGMSKEGEAGTRRDYGCRAAEKNQAVWTYSLRNDFGAWFRATKHESSANSRMDWLLGTDRWQWANEGWEMVRGDGRKAYSADETFYHIKFRELPLFSHAL